MTTKEIMVKSQPTRSGALAVIRARFQAFRLERSISQWKWLKPPEALTDGKTWRAYGRIEWGKR